VKLPIFNSPLLHHNQGNERDEREITLVSFSRDPGRNPSVDFLQLTSYECLGFGKQNNIPIHYNQVAAEDTISAAELIQQFKFSNLYDTKYRYTIKI